MKTSFKNKWIAYNRLRSSESETNRVAIFKGLSYLFVILLPFFLFLNNVDSPKLLIGYISLVLLGIMISIIIFDIVIDLRNRLINVTSIIYALIFLVVLTILCYKTFPGIFDV